jgi:hypothetical protein
MLSKSFELKQIAQYKINWMKYSIILSLNIFITYYSHVNNVYFTIL